MSLERFRLILRLLREDYERWDAPAKRFSNAYPRTPYTILISALLSSQTRDEVSLEAAKRLFALAKSPQDMLRLSEEEIARAIYPVGFWRKKAATILELSRTLIERHGGEVPATLSELKAIRGIGQKSAKIVLEHAYKHSVAAVDTHMHRILNLLEVVDTSTPEETDRVLEELLEVHELKGLNRLIVSFAQSICRVKKPKCSECVIRSYCPKFSQEV